MTLSSPLFCRNTSVKDSKKLRFVKSCCNQVRLPSNHNKRADFISQWHSPFGNAGVFSRALHELPRRPCLPSFARVKSLHVHDNGWMFLLSLVHNLMAFWLFNKVYWCTFFQFSFFSSETASSFFPNILLFNLDNAAFTFPIGPVLFVESTASNLREERLWKEPKAIATTVQARQITLYGILKSGVGRVMSRISVWRRRNTSSSGAASMLKRYYRKLHRIFL